MVDKESTCGCRFGGRVKRPTEGFKQTVDIAIEIAYFTDYGADEFGLVGRKIG